MSSFQAMFLRLVSGSVAKNFLDAQIKCLAVRSSAPHEIEDWHWTQTVQVDWQWLSTLNTDLGRSSVRWCWQSIIHIYALHIQRPLFLFQNLWHHAHWDTRNHACLKCLGCAACKAHGKNMPIYLSCPWMAEALHHLGTWFPHSFFVKRSLDETLPIYERHCRAKNRIVK